MHRQQAARYRIAILNPLNDYGISGYTHELAEGLAANGQAVTVYSGLHARLQDIPLQKSYRSRPVLGKALLRQSLLPKELPVASQDALACQHQEDTAEIERDGEFFRFAGGGVNKAAVWDAAGMDGVVSSSWKHRLHLWTRERFLSAELALHLWKEHFDLVWTQWYDSGAFDTDFWTMCRKLGVPVIHTVHNVLPHERTPEDWAIYHRIYKDARLLVVHSRQTLAELEAEFPDVPEKAIVMPHGVYSSIHRRVLQVREQIRAALEIPANSPVLLFLGAIRPYKNIDGLIEALATPSMGDVTLLVAGKEARYADSRPDAPLARTIRLLEEHGIRQQSRLLPGFLSAGQMSALLEASDALVTPYSKSYGSGLLLLGATFGKHLIATPTGGAAEYLARYERSTLLEDSSVQAIRRGLEEALPRIRTAREESAPPREWNWRDIASNVLAEITARLHPVGNEPSRAAASTSSSSS